MTFGMRTYSATGALVLSEDSIGGVFVDYVRHEDTDPTSYSYPDLAGMTLRVLQMAGSKFTWSVSYALGYPVISTMDTPVSENYGYAAALELLVFAS